MSRSLRLHAALCEAVGEGLRQGRAVRLVARGASMRPFLRDGEEIRIVPPPDGFPRSGEIVLIRTTGGAALHRVISVDEGNARIHTKGDGLAEADLPVPRSALIGCAEAVRRKGRWISLTAPWRRALGRFVSLFLAPRGPLRALARLLLRASRRPPAFAAISTGRDAPGGERS
jgi:hypothetical protein